MQFPGRRQGALPVGVIFDSDMGNGVEDVLALGLLYGFAARQEPLARVEFVSVSKSNLKAAALCEVVHRFYYENGDPKPVGFPTDGKLPEDTPVLTAPLAKQTADGKPAYEFQTQEIYHTAALVPSLRNTLTEQDDDQNTVVVLTGPARNLVGLLDLKSAHGFIESKVKSLVVQAGAFPNGPGGFNISTDVQAAQRLFAEWPTPVIAVGEEVARELHYPASSIESDFTWATHHPILDAYRAHQPMPYDAPAGAMAAALYAVQPEEGYFEVSEPGTIRVANDGSTDFSASAGGKHRYLVLDPARKERIVQAFVETMSAKPDPPQRRRFG